LTRQIDAVDPVEPSSACENCWRPRGPDAIES
jgi:hypothetical protein